PLAGFVNPSYDQVNAEIERLARNYDIPPIIIKHIAWKESDWEQYDMDAGDVKTGVDPGGTVGYGIMQVTVNPESPPPDVDDLKYDWKYNLERGVGKLLEKWYINVDGFTGWDADPAILENWYYAIAWYNGEGEPAYWYIHAVANEPDKSGIYTYIRDPAPQIAQYCTPIDITSPTVIESFSKEHTISGSPTGNQIYTLSQIIEAGGKIHKWHEGEDRYDEMNPLMYRALCPVDLVITDSSNRLISKSTNEIPNAKYTESDFDADGDLDDEVVIPEPLDGQYIIQIVPEPSASPTDVYTLKVWSNSSSLILANNVQIEDIPDQPYSVELNEAGIECTPIADAAGPYHCSEGSSVALDGSDSYDPDGNILQYRWDFDTDGIWDTEWLTEPTASCDWEDDFIGMVTLEVSDGEYTDTDTSAIAVENVAPTVTATDDGPKPEGESIAVAITQTDPGTSDTFMYSFDWNNDGTYEIVNQTSPSASHTWEDDGSYTVGVMVQDDDGGVGTTTVEVTVTDLAPTAAFTCVPDPQNENSPIQFSDASNSSPDLIASWSWDFGDGNSSDEKEPTHIYPDNGTYTVILTVTDDDGSTDDVPYDVKVDNVAPAVEAGPDQIVNEGTTLNFDGSFTDPGVDSHTIDWNFGDGGSAAGILIPTHTYGDNGLYTVTLDVVDDDSGTGSDNLTVTVNNVPPVVQAMDDQSTDEGTEINLDVAAFTDAGWLDSHTAVIDWGDGTTKAGIVNNPDGQGIVLGNHIYGDNGSYLVRVNVIDDDVEQGTDTFTFTVSNLAPIVGEISVSVDGIEVDAPVIGVSSEISATSSFSDSGAFDTHIASWDWGDGIVTTVEDTASPVVGSHVYAEAGVYTVKLTVTDDDGGMDSSEFRYIVVYDPSGGFVTGGGWIDSPPGAYVPEPTLIGKANFGFVSKYKKGANIPTGNTEFVFKVAELDFHSSEYEWLVVAGPQAKFKGIGAINSSGNYGFMLSAVDGQVNGGGDVDKFRIKIWDRDDDDKVIYDNQPGEADDSELTTVLGGGSIVIHGEKQNDANAAPGLSPDGTRLLAAYPNPFNPEVWIPYQLGSDSQVTIRIYDLTGHLVCILDLGTKPAGFYVDKSKAAHWDGNNDAGEQVASGVYFYSIQAGVYTNMRKMILSR
ncbi:PKD domain-containing protein, partial [Candidatus Poribacteria bacterium]